MSGRRYVGKFSLARPRSESQQSYYLGSWGACWSSDRGGIDKERW